MSMKTEAYTQRPIDAAQARVVALHQLINAAQTVFTAIRSPSSTEQRIELLERMVLLQTEAILGILPVLQEHEGQIDANNEAVDTLRDGIFGEEVMREPSAGPALTNAQMSNAVHSIHNVKDAEAELA